MFPVYSLFVKDFRVYANGTVVYTFEYDLRWIPYVYSDGGGV